MDVLPHLHEYESGQNDGGRGTTGLGEGTDTGGYY